MEGFKRGEHHSYSIDKSAAKQSARDRKKSQIMQDLEGYGKTGSQ